jgi:hypothetical protein
MNARTLILSIFVALTFAACGDEPCTPGICPDGQTECRPDERLPSFCPGEAPGTTPADAGTDK